MFDVRPVDKTGCLDMEKIESVRDFSALARSAQDRGKKSCRLSAEIECSTQDIKRTPKIAYKPEPKKPLPLEIRVSDEEYKKPENIAFDFSKEIKNYSKYFWLVFKLSLSVLALFFLFNFISQGLQIKKEGLSQGQTALAELMAAKDSIKKGDFRGSYLQFKNAHEKLSEISKNLDDMNALVVGVTKYLPYLSKISSGSHLVAVGNDISQVGILLSDQLATLDKIKSNASGGETVSYLELFQGSETNIKKISELLVDAQNNVESVNADDVPENYREKFSEIRNTLPEINKTLSEFLGQEKILSDILGGNGPRKYLFLFQNNQEMRPTGGFIGSYGLLDIFNGRVRKFFIDGIFNPDGQLRERVVPPVPIQKISANWSLHDSNWFPDFPKSAEKAAWFYEKTGGPTVDGVIAMTPTILGKLLAVTGPIDMPEYGVTVTEDNFIEKIQYEVEVDYDKDLNQPKKILGDLAPKILDKIFNSGSFSDLSQTLNIFVDSLNEKQVLIYSKNWEIEKVLSENGWSGEILNSPKDYVSVINTNINGFKTDGMIQEEISHNANIQPDGSIIDTLIVKRKHTGGDTAYEWWNKVNADYMRVYVPKGARLLSAEGQTREFNAPPLDYSALGYKRDPQVQMEEDSMRIDQESGTRVYEDGEKTVFANWVYVSPKETATVKYTYILPFKIEMSAKNPADNYSLLAQKQSGSMGSKFISQINYPKSYKILWRYPENGPIQLSGLPDNQEGIKMESELNVDRFVGLAFQKY
jgi:hypothetical protein